MKKVLVLLVAIMCCLTTKAQISAGVGDSRYVYGSYTLSNGLSFNLEHSLYSEKFGFQRVAIGVGYGSALPYGFSWKADVNGGTTWNRNYQVVYGDLAIGYLFRRLGLESIVQPHYDSGLGYTTCWQAGASVRIIEPVSVCLAYTTIPEYRMSENRLRGGFEFSVDKLSVKPEISISMDKETRLKNMRVLMSMNYRF